MISGIDFSELRFASSASRRRRRRRRQEQYLNSQPIYVAGFIPMEQTQFSDADLKSAIKNFETNLQGASESDRYNALNQYYNAIYLLPNALLRHYLQELGGRIMRFMDSYGHVKSMETALPGVPMTIVAHQKTIEYTLVNMPDSEYKTLWLETLEKSGNPFLREIAHHMQLRQTQKTGIPIFLLSEDIAEQLKTLSKQTPDLKKAIYDYYGTMDQDPTANRVMKVMGDRAITLLKNKRSWWQKLLAKPVDPKEQHWLIKTMLHIALYSGQGMCPELPYADLESLKPVSERLTVLDINLRKLVLDYHVNPAKAKAEIEAAKKEQQQLIQTIQTKVLAVSAEKLDSIVQESLKAIQDPNLAKLLAQSEETRYRLLAQAEPVQKENLLEPYLKEAREKK